MMVRFASGAMGHLYFSRAATGRKMGYAYEIHGTKGAIRFDQEDQNAVWLYRAEGPEATRGFTRILTGPEHPDYLPFCQGPGHGTGYQDQIIIEARDFLRAIADGRTRLADLPRRPRRRPRHRHRLRLGRGWPLASSPAGLKGNMTIRIGNAPCSWGVEFPQRSAQPALAAGAEGMRRGRLYRHRARPRGLHARGPGDPRRGAGRTRARADRRRGLPRLPRSRPVGRRPRRRGAHLQGAGGAWRAAPRPDRLDLAPPRADGGRAEAAEQMDAAEWAAFRDRIAHVARMGAEEYGLTVGIHAHAAGFMDFEPELERLLDEVPEDILRICFDTGHHSYAGFDPVAFMRRHIGRISYMHFKDIDPVVKADAIAQGHRLLRGLRAGHLLQSGQGDVDFPAVRQILLDAGFEGWCTVEQDCDPTLDVSPVDDARANREYLAKHRILRGRR
jgi:inosose dehydratase